MDVKGPDGKVENWAFEAGTPNVLFRRGFTRKSLMPGTVMVIDGYQAKDGIAPRQRPRHHLRRRQEAVHGLVRHRRAVRTESEADRQVGCAFAGATAVSPRLRLTRNHSSGLAARTRPASPARTRAHKATTGFGRGSAPCCLAR